MTIYYLCPGTRETISGGTRKLFDHAAILAAHGFDARLIYTHDVAHTEFTERDVVVVPEVYGDGIRDFVPAGVKRIVFVQNSYLIDAADGTVLVHDPDRHPYMTTPELLAIFTESAHTTERLRDRFPDLPVPLIRTHSSGNGRRGEDAGFRYGSWPRERRVVYFGYKHEVVNAALFAELDLPDGWTIESMSGLADAEITERLRTSAIFAAANTIEGMCAPTSEAMISGAVIVCWTGGGPDEYLLGRAVIAHQDDLPDLRDALAKTARDIDGWPDYWAHRTRQWSDWFQATYSRQGEIAEIVDIFTKLGYACS